MATGGGGAGGDGGVPTQESFCTDAGLCWDLPRPTGVEWSSVFATGPTDVWLAGERDALAHYDGTRLTRVDSEALIGRPPRAGLRLRTVWGLGPGDVWVTGDNAPLLHYGSGGWSHVPVGMAGADAPHDCTGVHGVAADRVWVSCDGTQYLGSTLELDAVASDAGDCKVLLADDGGVFCISSQSVVRIDASGHVTDVTPAATAQFSSLVRLSNGETWLAGSIPPAPYLSILQSNFGWSEATPPSSCHAEVRALAEDSSGTLLMLCGAPTVDNELVTFAEPQRLRLGTYEPMLEHLSAAGGFAVAAGAGGELVVREGGTWRDVIEGDDRTFAAGGAADGVLYAVGLGGLFMRRDADGGWSAPPGSGTADIWGVAGTDAGVWVAQNQTLRKVTSSPPWLDEMNAGGMLSSLWAAGDELWAGTWNGAILHRTASQTWAVERDAGSLTVRGLWGTAPDSMFAVGLMLGLARQADGTWLSETVPQGASLMAVTGSGSHVWALGTNGTVYAHADGGWSIWSTSKTHCAGTRLAIAASGGDVWLTDTNELCVLRAGSTEPTPYVLPVDDYVRSMLVDGNTLWLFGASGAVLRKSLP